MNRKAIIRIVVLAGLVAAGIYYRAPLAAWARGVYAGQIASRLPGGSGPSGGTATPAGADLVASGTIEAHTIAVSGSNAGRLAALHVAEGDRVAAGDLIAELDTTLNQAEIGQARSGVAQAQAQVALLKAGPRPADVAVARAALAQAQAARDAGRTAWQDAQALVDAPSSLDVKIAAAEAAVQAGEQQALASQAGATAADLENDLWGRTVKLLQDGFDVTINKLPTKPTVHVEIPADKLNQAQLQWNQSSQKQWQAHAQANIAQAAVETARQNLADLRSQKADPATLRAQANSAEAAFHSAEAAVATAQANLDVILAGAPAEQIQTAEAAVRQAEAGLQAPQVKANQARIVAPQAGTVTTVVLHKGEVAAPGSPIAQLADLGEVTLTVYVPEPQLGRVHLGQAVLVTVDSFPGRSFPGAVTQIADQAEFTPKNVQTRDERANTVYAVKISLKNGDDSLKPGMPADAYFGVAGGEGLPVSARATAANPSSGSTIQASGTVEGTETTISAEIGGRVLAVNAAEGDQVAAGKGLVKLDGGSLAAQADQAQAAIATAKADLARVAAAPQAARVSLAQAQVAQARAVLAGAQAGLADARQLRADPQDLTSQINNARSQLAAATAAVDLQRANLKAAQVLQASLQPDTGSDLDRTRRAMYDQQVAAAQAALNAGQAQQNGAQASLDRLQAMLARPVSLDAAVHKAEGQVLQANAAVSVTLASLAQVQAPAQAEAITLAQTKVDQAQAAANLLQATLAKLDLTSPVSGTVTAQVIHLGEVAQPGQTLLTLMDLSHVKLAIYVPAGRIGQVRLGQASQVTVDAYPGRKFRGTVTHINDQAEFTPKNVQTQEERVKTVFKVEIALDNPDGALKPGMPADAVLQ
ncbi:MAG TPA: efflux RND transporter periplasmic adaptor subunit [Anaerolineae bacterium]